MQSSTQGTTSASRTLAAMATLLLAAPAASQASNSSLTILGDLPGGITSTFAYGVSADESTVVGESRSGSGPEAFRWSAASGIAGLGDLPGAEFSSSARDVSGDGAVVRQC